MSRRSSYVTRVFLYVFLHYPSPGQPCSEKAAQALTMTVLLADLAGPGPYELAPMPSRSEESLNTSARLALRGSAHVDTILTAQLPSRLG